MIINPIIIAGAGGGVNTYVTQYNITSNETVSTFFANHDVRFHYKTSILYLYTSNNNRELDGSNSQKILSVAIPNVDNFTNPTGYDAVVFYGNRQAYYWGILTNTATSNKTTITASDFSTDSTTGRISSSSTLTYYLGRNGTIITAFEIPISPLYTDSGDINTTPWGTP